MENTTISRSDLEWMLQAVKETHRGLQKVNKELDEAFNNRGEDFNPYSHIGILGAQLIIAEIELRSILKVVQGE
jgi:hypothetical protein